MRRRLIEDRKTVEDFNPRTRVGCDVLRLLWSSPSFISIHAPAWDATSAISGTTDDRPISIHAPAWDATYPCGSSIYIISIFQSTHPRGMRQQRANVSICKLTISIHAPAWDATADQSTSTLKYLISIHAPAWDATLKYMRITP